MFRDLCNDDLVKIADISVYQKKAKGEVLFSEGVESDGFFLVISGKIKVFKISLSGKEQIIHIIYPLETFAEASMFSGKSFPASAEALENAELLFIPKALFTSLIEERPHLAIGIIASFSRLMRQFNILIEELALKDVPARLARYILDIPQRQVLANGSITVELAFSKTHLASHLGTTIETLSRSLKKLKERELLTINRREIIILRPDELCDIASGRVKL